MDGEWDGRTKLGQSVANGGCGSGGGYSFSPLFLLSPLSILAALPARGELLPPRVRSCVSAVADGPVAGERKEGRKVTSSVANGR